MEIINEPGVKLTTAKRVPKVSKRLMVDPQTGQTMKMPKVTGGLIKANINNAPALYNLGTFEIQQKNYDLALKCLKPAWELEKNPETLLNLTTAYRFAGFPNKAWELLELCITKYPKFALAYNNLGLLYYDANKFEKAQELYEKAIELSPDYADAHWNLSLVYGINIFEKGTGEIKNMMREYAWRFKKTSPVPISPTLGTSEWRGESLEGKKLLIMCEQGFGDMIQFIRYGYCFPSDQVIFHMPEGLHPLIKEEYQVTNVSTIKHDYWIPMCSLLNFVPIGDGEPYMTELRDPKTRKYADLGDGINIGIVWKGSKQHQNDANRSLHYRDFFWLFKYGRVWSLQKDEKLPKHVKDIHSLPINNWTDTFNYIKALDVVVTVDTSVAHLCGAMGKPVITLIPANGIDWRWGISSTSTVWYKSMYLARKRSMEDAEKKLNEIISSLRI